MSVKKIFWENPYLTKTQAKITSVENNIITVNQTIAFAYSGGQQSDSGNINEYEIIEARKDDKQILYTIPTGHNLKINDTILMEINWKKRYRIMKLHFAAEIILELVYQDYNYPKKIGANITEDKARLDFNWQRNISEIFPELKEKSKHIIDSNLDIISDFSNKDNEERYWEIKGFAKVPCGGTHLKKTGEIGAISLKRNNLGYGKERIEIYLL